VPELPEVETVRRQLDRVLPGRDIACVESVDPFILRDAAAEDVPALVEGHTADRVERVGKFLVVSLSGGVFLTIHLGMTGQLLLLAREDEVTHTRFSALLDGGTERFVFRDVRKFGRLHVTEGGPAERLWGLGPDAWLGDWDTGYLSERLRGRTAPLKAFLLDQRHLAGIGNIYADEVLFGARLSPWREAGTLTREETERLAVEIRERLDEGVRLRGCSISDFVDTEGAPGSYQEALRAYGRHGAPCVVCGRPLTRTLVAGRGTAFCAHCQR
jgi:formamidopyrimidine-DNA glycosylase